MAISLALFPLLNFIISLFRILVCVCVCVQSQGFQAFLSFELPHFFFFPSMVLILYNSYKKVKSFEKISKTNSEIALQFH